MSISKTKYTRYVQCPKMLWLDFNKPELAEQSPMQEKVFATGHKVGELAKKYFGNFVETTVFAEDGEIDKNAMVQKTKDFLDANEENICEAAFMFGNYYCAVDLLHKVDGGYEIYEVKSSTKIRNINLVDVAFQKYILEHCGINVINTYILCVNNQYVQQGDVKSESDINLKEYFSLHNVNEDVIKYYNQVEKRLEKLNEYLAKETEPEKELSVNCQNPYKCEYFKYCSRCLPVHSVFDLCSVNFEKACEYMANGITTFEDVLDSGILLTRKQEAQINACLYNEPTFIDKPRVRKFLEKLTFPLYFLDFETFMDAIPRFDGQRPYQQIPFQYSLHILKDIDGNSLEHKEFLADENTDSRYAIAKSLVDNIPDNVCVVAYNMKFERGRLKELAEQFPEFSEHLLKIEGNIVDLYDVFFKGYVYDKAMGNSFSIKSVLPALCPNNPNLNYHNLDVVQNGTDANEIFLSLTNMNEEERNIARTNLLKYCELDTYAMVVIYLWLVENSKG